MDEDTHVIENQDANDNDDNGAKKANPLLLGGVVLAVLLLFGGVVLSQRNKSVNTESQEVLSENQEMVVEDTTEVNEENTEFEATGEIVDQPEEPSENTEPTLEEDANLNVIEVEGGSFYFKPNTISVNKGETVKIVFNNVDGMHDFVVDELGIKTPVIKASETTEVEFTADEAGEFEFYCSVGSHRQMGMKGTLIVQ